MSSLMKLTLLSMKKIKIPNLNSWSEGMMDNIVKVANGNQVNMVLIRLIL